jgi:hypothetical protein
MTRDEYMPIVIERFNEWYGDLHSQNEDRYIHEITRENIISMSEFDFTEFFYHFVEAGGSLQSGGHRYKFRFRHTIEENHTEFKNYVIRPFENDFDVEAWLFDERKQFSYFGIGIASIYLNRVNKHRYSVMNNKTQDSLRALEYDIPSTKNENCYRIVHEIQTELIEKYPIEINNYYRADALNEFIIGRQYITELNVLKSR